jgi:hypothetical protein
MERASELIGGFSSHFNVARRGLETSATTEGENHVYLEGLLLRLHLRSTPKVSRISVTSLGAIPPPETGLFPKPIPVQDRLLMRIYQGMHVHEGNVVHSCRLWHQTDPVQYVLPTPLEQSVMDKVYDMVPDWSWLGDPTMCTRVGFLGRDLRPWGAEFAGKLPN